MKRSRVNDMLREGAGFIRSFGYTLPPFADWTPAAMKARRGEIGRIVEAGLGWDITDYGAGNFASKGLFLFTLRNGDTAALERGRGMLYAEKVMISRRQQVSPMHRHAIKAEDIVNRGGGTLCIELYASRPDGSIDRQAPLSVPTDGILRQIAAGGILRLSPGESVTLLPGMWHAFWGEGSDVLVGEISTVNDDLTDNIFADPVERFSTIEEDEEPYRLLVSDYPAWFGA